jgi:hypothetical protein
VSNQPLNPTAMFQEALRRRDVDQAWDWALKVRPLRLHDALFLTVALGIADDSRYSAAAARFLERYIEEAHPTGEQEAKVQVLLDNLGQQGPPPFKYGAGEDLRALAERLSEAPPRFTERP